MTEYSRIGYRLRLADFEEEGMGLSTGFWKAVSEEVVSIGKQDFKLLFETLKSRIKTNIDDDRKSKFFPSPVGYVPGALGRSSHYRIREYKSGKGVNLRGFFTVGEDIVYARIHDREGETVITPSSGPYLVFFNHVTGVWSKARAVNRPGSPYFDDAVDYSLKKIGIIQ